jgi:hypothetical protein
MPNAVGRRWSRACRSLPDRVGSPIMLLDD